MAKERTLLFFILLTFVNIITPSVSTRGYCPGVNIPRFGKCGYNGYECLDGACIKRSQYCDGHKDCSDNSDEHKCNSGDCKQLETYRMVRCNRSYKCYPSVWNCDGTKDCKNGIDENNCINVTTYDPVDELPFAIQESVGWFNSSTVPDSPNRKWGPLVHKTAVALFLSDPSFVSDDSSTRREISNEISIQLLSKLNQEKLQGIPSSDLASFVNAFLVTCIDPREFHGFNLVTELRSRVEKEKNYTLPYLLLTLCNAGDTITDSDVEALKNAFWNPNREIWTVNVTTYDPVDELPFAIQESVGWFNSSTVPDSPNRKWGPLVHKTAVALFLSDPSFVSDDSSTRREISNEISIQLLSKLNQEKLQGIPSSDLASFINAFLVTCIDPREFHGFNLVTDLRSRVEKEKNYTLPYLLLTLCNAGDTITDSDVEALKNAFWNPNREIWTDVQAIALMALSCARNQIGSSVDDALVVECALELKQRQYRNGTVENLQNTLLVMQALYATQPDEDPDNFDEKKALSYILQNKKSDGSFGNHLLTYYALPVLNCKSLVNISSSHCKPVQVDEDTAVFDLMNYNGPKIRVRYSVWLGMKRDIERTLSIRVPANVSFYRVMEIAAEIDNKYKFEYIMKNRKPYITSIAGTMDDSETEHYWFPYIVKDGKPSLLEQSTADIIPKNDDHIVMWYRKGDWLE